MLGISKEPGAGSYGAGTEGGIIGTSLTGTVKPPRATGAPTGPTPAAPGGDLRKPPPGVVPNGRGGGATGPTGPMVPTAGAGCVGDGPTGPTGMAGPTVGPRLGPTVGPKAGTTGCEICDTCGGCEWWEYVWEGPCAKDPNGSCHGLVSE